MKIVKCGLKPESMHPSVRFKCRICGCEFEAEKGEYSIISNYRNDLVYEVYCPFCKRTHYEEMKGETNNV